MRIIKPSTLTAWAARHANAAPARWQSLADARRDFPHADMVRAGRLRPVIVFNLAGGKFRLIAAIHFNNGRVFLLDFLTHAEYSKPGWKNRL